jgi:squalene cyclase
MRISTSLVAKAGAVVAAAAVALSGAAAAADASTAHPVKVTTALSIANTTPKAHPHQTTAWVYGYLTAPNDKNAPVRGVWVVLQRQGPKGHWFGVQAERTGRKGGVRFFVHVYKKAVTFRLVFHGQRNFARSVSATDTIAPATAS